MSKKLWEASPETQKNMILYYRKLRALYISKKFNQKFNQKFDQKYENILKWSIKNQGDFWSSIWDFSKIKGLKE